MSEGESLDEVDAWFDEVPSWGGGGDKGTTSPAPQESAAPRRSTEDSQAELEAILGESMRFAAKASKREKAMLKEALEAAPEMDMSSAIDAPSRAEMKTLRKEFSVVGELEATQRKRAMLVALSIAALAALGGVAVVANQLMQEGVEKPDYGPTKSAPEVKRTLYDVPAEEVMPAAPGGVMSPLTGEKQEIEPKPESSAAAAANKSLTSPGSKKKTASSSAKRSKASGQRRVNTSAKKEAERASKVKKMSESEFAQLSRAQGGKAEVKLPTSSRTLSGAKKPKKEAKGAKGFSERAKKVTSLIAKKRRLLAQCKSDQDEKVKVTFTIALTGKVTSVRIKGTKNERKKSCIANVFWRSIFPKGEQSDTFSLPFTI